MQLYKTQRQLHLVLEEFDHLLDFHYHQLRHHQHLDQQMDPFLHRHLVLEEELLEVCYLCLVELEQM
jgi:hypothetical protein